MTLAVPDQHHAAALIVMGQIIVPGRQHVIIGHLAIGRDRPAGHEGAQGGQGDLPVHRREQTAFRPEAGELLLDDALLFRADDPIGIAAGLGRDRRIDIKAIDRRFRVGREGFMRQRAVGGNDGGRQIDRAGILPAGPAQPGSGIGIDIGAGRLGPGIIGKQAQGGQRRQDHESTDRTRHGSPRESSI